MASIFFAFTRRPRPPTSLPRPFLRPAPRQQRAPFSATPRQRFYRRSPISLLRNWAARPTFLYEVGAVSGAGGLFYYSNLERVPMSGRLRFNILSPEYERKMGYSTFHSVVEEFQGHILPGFAPEAQRVHRVLARLVEGLGKLGGDLAPAIGDTDIENWEVYVVNSKEANAFVIPGNKVFVFTGILPLAKTDDELATVLGHEIAHNYCHHAAENVSRSMLITAAVVLVTMVMEGGFDLSRIFADLALNLPNSRTMESEADQVGLSLMAAACFDPKAAVPFWEKMGRADKANVPELMSTHPSDTTRVRNITGWMDEAVAKYDNAGCAETRYQRESFQSAASD